MPDDALSLRLVSACHENTVILGAMTLTLSRGETVALSGPSGVGKTTLLRVIAGLHPNWKGQIHRRGKLAAVFQSPTLMPWRSVLENITIPTQCDPKLAQSLLQETGLAGTEARFPEALSLGQQRRLSLARALAAEPDILLMDEPFVSLDPKTSDEMMDLIDRSLSARKIAVLMVTHAEAEAKRLASRVLRLEGKPARISG